MPFHLELPAASKKAGWKVKIRDKERVEPPHVTVLFGPKTWRVNLRTREFMEEGHSWNQLDPVVAESILDHWDVLCAEWDRMYPDNPVASPVDDEDAG